MDKTYENLVREVQRLQKQGQLPVQPTRDQRIGWAYGNTKIENEAVTVDMAVDAVDRHPKTQRR